MAGQAILLTGPGVGAIAVVRLRGNGVAAFLARHFTGKVRDGVAVHGRLVDGDREIDDPLVIWEESTQTADVCVHGGTWVVHEILELAGRAGFEVEPGKPGSALPPLPELAVDAEDELEREILEWLPAARTQEAIQTLLGQREAWKNLQLTTPEAAAQILSDRSLHWLLHPPRIAIIGIPNAGKSTLANRLFGQDRSIVADLPGTTRDYVEDLANLGGLAVLLVDTPGLRAGGDAIEAAAIELSEELITSADLRILLLDPTQPREPQELLATRHPDALCVSGKADLGVLWEGIAVSAADGSGMADLERAIRRHFACEVIPHKRACIWTTRQRENALRQAAQSDPP